MALNQNLYIYIIYGNIIIYHHPIYLEKKSRQNANSSTHIDTPYSFVEEI